MSIQTVLDLLETGNLPAAFKECLALNKKYPADANTQHLLGLIYAKQGEIPAAIVHFKNAINLDPHQAIFHNNLSNAYKLMGDLESATRHLNEALQLQPNNAESFNNLGSLFYTQGDIPNAMQQYAKAIRLNPGSWEAHYNLANCCIKQDMVLQATNHYRTTLNLNPQHSAAKQNLAMSYVLVHDYAAALPLLIEIADNNPQHAELQGHLAETYLNLGQSDNALQQYIKAITLEPTRPAWQHNLGVLYLRSGQTEKAKEHFAIALELQPDNPTAQHMLSALNANTTPAAPPEYVKALFDQYASYYNQHMQQALHYTVPQLLRQAISKFITHTTKQQQILDLGCGTGLCGIYFRDLARFLVGVDISPTMLLEAKNLGAYDALCCCNILQTIPGINTMHFDLVIAADVFVYIGDLAPLFTMIYSALKVDGFLMFTVEDQTQNESFLLQKSGRYSHSQAYLQQLAVNHGFETEINETITPRVQDEKAIAGRLYVLRKNLATIN